MRRIMTLKAFINNVRPTLRRHDLLGGYATDPEVLEIAMSVVEWTYDDVKKNGYDKLLEAVRLQAEAYKRHAMEQASDYFSVYG